MDGWQRRRPGRTPAEEARRDGGSEGGPEGWRRRRPGRDAESDGWSRRQRWQRRPGRTAAEEARKDGDGGDPFKHILAIPALIAKCQFKNNLNVKCRRGRAHTQRHGGKKQMPNSEYTCRINTDLHLHKSRPFLAQFYIAFQILHRFHWLPKVRRKKL